MAQGSLPKWSAARLKQNGRYYLKLLQDYRLLFFSGVLLLGSNLVLNSIAPWSGSPNLCTASMLCTHGATPWGILTSVLLYDGWTNIPSYFVILISYISFSDRVDSDERRRRARFAATSALAAAVTANALWMLALPSTYSWGPSGVVYALWGVLLAFTLFDGMPNQPKSLDPRTWYKDKKERSSAIGNLAIFASTAIVLVFQPAEFLSTGPNVNVFAHGVSFLSGYFSAHIYKWAHRRPDQTN